MEAAVKRARGEVLPVCGEGDRVDWVRVLVEHVGAGAGGWVPEANRGVERGGGQHQLAAGVGGAGAGRRPFDRVDLLLVLRQILHAAIRLQAPDLPAEMAGW